MVNISAYQVLLWVCVLVILSYLYTVINRLTRIPSVLLLLLTGMGLRWLQTQFGLPFSIPPALVEILGTVGLIMIVLEAGLDLHITKKRLPLVRNSFFSAFAILILSAGAVSALLHIYLPGHSWINYLTYAIPLSIVSSAIVLPSVHHLNHDKKEFLIYEASFSDVLGIMAFNFFTTEEVITSQSVSWFVSSLFIALLLSIVVCFGLMLLLVKNNINVKFFLVFAVLIFIYTGGKMLHLPSLITILIFGLVVNNWGGFHWKPLHRFFPTESVNSMAAFLKSSTAESSFLIRTFFFVIFGFQIDLAFLNDPAVWELGSGIVAALLVLRYVYLRILHRYNLFPELFYIPRGLITILLFYKIPKWMKMQEFNEGVLFFVILATSLIMMLGAIFYRDAPIEMKEMEEAFDAEQIEQNQSTHE